MKTFFGIGALLFVTFGSCWVSPALVHQPHWDNFAMNSLPAVVFSIMFLAMRK